MRVIAGALGGRRLVAPPGRATRPTSDRVREALFSVLGDVTGVRVLDLYAGTGALGIEALSRGAREAVFVENGPAALAALKKNVAALGLESRCVIVAAAVERSAGRLEGSFELVFADPPYAEVERAARALEKLRERWAAAVRVVLEHASRDEAPEITGLERGTTRKYGDTAVTLYQATG